MTVVSADKDDFNLPCKVARVSNSTAFIKQITKALIEAGCVPKDADGFDEFSASLSKVEVSDDAKALAESYLKAKNALILFPIHELTGAAMTEIANMAVVSGHIGSFGNGIYMQRQMAGSQVLADYGITGKADVASDAKGLMVFGEDVEIDERVLEDLEFLAVQDTHLTELASKADVVFPMAAYPELYGVFVNSDRCLQQCRKAVSPPVEYRTAEIAQRIAEVLEGSDSVSPGFIADLYQGTEIGNSWPAPVLFSNGYPGFPDGRAKLQVLDEAAMFDPAKPPCHIMKSIMAELGYS